MKQLFEKTCSYCGNTFIANNYKKKYCSGTCRTYASQERRGRLNSTQQAIKEGRIQPAIGGLPMASRNKEAIITQLATGYLNSLFTLEGKYYFNVPGEKDPESLENEFPHPYEDIELGIQRISLTESGNFIVTSMCKPVIEEIRKKFKGSKIIMGSSPEITDNFMPPPNFADKAENERTMGRVYTLPTYSTILSRGKVIKKAGIEVDMI